MATIDRETALLATALRQIDEAWERELLTGERPEINTAKCDEIIVVAEAAGVRFEEDEVLEMVGAIAAGLGSGA
jgi:hypothetical protein